MKREQKPQCGVCKAEERWLLHNVRYKGEHNRLCTNCVLNNHLPLFCPFCFQVYDYEEDSSSASAFSSPFIHQKPTKAKAKAKDRVTCTKCTSVSHLSCIPSNSLPSSFLCPSCSSFTHNSSFFFNPTNSKKIKTNHDHDHNHNDNDYSESERRMIMMRRRVIDKDSARALVAAAKIATISITKFANHLRAVAERKVKDAADAKKKAREALETLAYLVAKDKDKKHFKPNNYNNSDHGINYGHDQIKADDGVIKGDTESNGMIYPVSSTIADVNVSAGQLRGQQQSNNAMGD